MLGFGETGRGWWEETVKAVERCARSGHAAEAVLMRGLPRQGSGGAGGNAAVDQKGLAGDVGAGVGGEEDNGAFEVGRLAGAFERDAVAEIFDPFFIFVHDGVLGGLEPSGGEAVYGDAVRAPIVSETHRELFDA